MTRTARTTRPTAAPLISGSGSLNGIADQLSLPSISTSLLRAHAGISRTRHSSLEDVFEQLRLDRAISFRRHVFARLCQLGIAGIVEAGSCAARLRKPGVEIAGRHRLHDKSHPGKTVAAEIRRQARILTRGVGEKIQMRDHATHGVDLAAELRHEK